MEPTLPHLMEQARQAKEEANSIREEKCRAQERLHEMVKAATQDAIKARTIREEAQQTLLWLRRLGS